MINREVIQNINKHTEDIKNLGSSLESNAKKQMISITDFGAISGQDCTQAFIKAINEASKFINEELGAVGIYVPSGSWLVNSDVIVLPNQVCIIGENENTTTIECNDSKKGVGITLNSFSECLHIRVIRFKIGIKTIRAASKVMFCKVQYNTIGIYMETNPYICRVQFNYIGTNSSIGVLVGKESYQTLITDNWIEGNQGIGIGLIGTSCGALIERNTIEGSYNVATKIGCGVFICAGSLSRLVISKNWLENNGTHDDSCNIYMKSTQTRGAQIYNSIASVIPEEFKSLFTASVSLVNCEISNNYNSITKTSFYISVTRGIVNVKTNKFVVERDYVIKPIYLSIGSEKARIDIDNNSYEDPLESVESTIEKGVCGTIVYTENKSKYDNVFYNKQKLFIKSVKFDDLLNMGEFISMQPWDTVGGESTKVKYSVALKTYVGYKSNGTGSTGTIRYGTAENNTDFANKTGWYCLPIGEKDSGILLRKQDGTYMNMAIGIRKTFSPYLIPSLGSDTAYILKDKVCYGVLMVSPTNYEKYFKDVYSVEILDFETQLVNP